ncbi:MAG: hypothetical protein ACREO8_13640 [Luteimonas sp.]
MALMVMILIGMSMPSVGEREKSGLISVDVLLATVLPASTCGLSRRACEPLAAYAFRAGASGFGTGARRSSQDRVQSSEANSA